MGGASTAFTGKEGSYNVVAVAISESVSHHKKVE